MNCLFIARKVDKDIHYHEGHLETHLTDKQVGINLLKTLTGKIPLLVQTHLDEQ